jgi:MFS family permease
MIQQQQDQQQQSQRWSNLALLRLGAFGFGITGFFMAMDTIILPVLVLEVVPEGAKNTLLGVLGLSGLIVAALVQPMVGWYSDRTSSPLGRRVPYMLWGGVFVSLGLMGLGFISDYLSLFALWLVIQANASIAYGPFQALIRDLVPARRIGIASSLKILADGAGGVIIIAVSGALIGRYTRFDSENWLWITLGVLAITLMVTAVISASIVLAREKAAGITRKRIFVGLRPSGKLHPQLKWFIASRYLMITAIFVYPTYGLFFLRDVVGVANPPQTLGLMILSIGGALVLSIYPAGWLSDQIGRKPVVISGAIGAAVGSITILYASNPTEVVAVASIIGASVGVVLSANWALANELGTVGREGQHMGIVNLATVGGAASAKILGPGVDLLNLAGPGLGYSALLMGSGAAFLLGALFLIPLKAGNLITHSPETPPKRPPLRDS